jgi:hypothetical protein
MHRRRWRALTRFLSVDCKVFCYWHRSMKNCGLELTLLVAALQNMIDAVQTHKQRPTKTTTGPFVAS